MFLCFKLDERIKLWSVPYFDFLVKAEVTLHFFIEGLKLD